MIEYNLCPETSQGINHPLDGKWARLTSGIWMNHLCDVVDNHDEVVNGTYTNKSAKLLLHMSPRVRRYVDAKLFRDFLYVGIWKDDDIPEFSNWDYKLECPLDTSQIILDLKTVLYDLEPMLTGSTCIGYRGHPIWENPNAYWGEYLLNDEEVYRIYRKYDTVTFSQGNKEIHTFKINKGLFELAVDVDSQRKNIVCNADRLLLTNELNDYVSKYNRDKKKLDICLQFM